MAKWDFKIVGASFVKELVPVLGDSNPRSESFMQPSFDLEGGKIVMKESGQYKTAIYFSQIGEIDGVAPTDIEDAYAKLLTLVENFNGGGGAPGTTPNLTQVLTIQDRVHKEIGGDYTIVDEDRTKWLLYVANTGSIGTITLDDTYDLLAIYSEIPIKIQLDCNFAVVGTDVRSNLGVDVNTPITSASFYKGDTVELKKIGSGIWFLQVVNYSIGGGGGAVDSVNGQTGVVVLDATDVGAEPTKGSDDNYVTDAQLVVIGNTSGTNTGDNATNSLYSGLATSKQDVSTLLVDSIDKAILRNNYFWFLPNTVTNGSAASFGYSERISSTFIVLLNGNLLRGMFTFATTAIAGTIASMRRNESLQIQGYECKFTRKIQFNSNVSGQRFFCGISKGNQFAIATNVEPNTLTDIVGVCQLSTSTNMHIVYNDASGTATTSDLGSSYPCNDSQYNYYITIEQTTTSYIVTVERVTVATGASISTSLTTITNIPNYATGVIQLFTFITNNATGEIASYLDGGGIGSFKN
jgi:hypothetical protein